MYGTLAGALSARQVDFDRERYTADVEGVIEAGAGSDGPSRTIRITEIVVRYHLVVPAAQRAEVDRALEVHPAGCPAHESVKNAIAVRWEADIEEM